MKLQFRLDLIRPNVGPIEIGIWEPPESMFVDRESIPPLNYIAMAELSYMPGLLEPIRFQVTRIH